MTLQSAVALTMIQHTATDCYAASTHMKASAALQLFVLYMTHPLQVRTAYSKQPAYGNACTAATSR